MIGLGRMGGNMAERLRRGGHEVVGYDRTPGTRDVETLEDLVTSLPTPRVVWVMVPAGQPTYDTIDALGELLEPGDVIVDGGNSRYTDDQRHALDLEPKGIGFVDCGVSGGVWGLTEGYALMCGGKPDDVAKAQPFFDVLKPEGDSGFVHAGEVGAGHFAKMVHNGIEYGLMQAYAEGWELMMATDVVTDVPAVIASWQKGTVIRSWLLDLMVNALEQDADLSALKGYAEDSGEGRWTVQAAVDHAVPLPVITASLFARFSSRQDDSPAMKMIAALRNQFGGHAVTSRAGSVEKGADSPGADVAGAEDADPAHGRERGEPGTPPGA
jgi:6-phosphogluconate dehydrogenase